MPNSGLKPQPKFNPANRKTCASCNSKIQTDGMHDYQGNALCEDCFIEVKIRPKRVTHWRYLRSIKNDYLKPGRQKS